MNHAWMMMRGRRALGETTTRADFATELRAAWAKIKADRIERARLAAMPQRRPTNAFRRCNASVLTISPMTNALRRAGASNIREKSRQQSYVVSMVGA